MRHAVYANTKPFRADKSSDWEPRGNSLYKRADRVYNDFFRGRVIVDQTSASPLPEESDPLAPQREAAMFYGLFLRGHSAESLRKDIEIPRQLVDKLLKRRCGEPSFRKSVQRVYHYRRKVLAIFDELVLNERTRLRLQ
jgi:hypothetical protein